MKARSFIVSVLAVAIAGEGIWWFTRPPAVSSVAGPADADPNSPTVGTSAEKSGATPTPTIPAPPQPSALKTVALSPEVVAPAASPELIAKVQSELKPILADLAEHYRNDDPAGALLAYTQPGKSEGKGNPPKQELDFQTLTPAQQRAVHIAFENVAQGYDRLATQIPQVNSAGTEAVYQNVEGKDQGTTTFVKMDGRWYLVQPAATGKSWSMSNGPGP